MCRILKCTRAYTIMIYPAIICIIINICIFHICVGVFVLGIYSRRKTSCPEPEFPTIHARDTPPPSLPPASSSLSYCYANLYLKHFFFFISLVINDSSLYFIHIFIDIISVITHLAGYVQVNRIWFIGLIVYVNLNIKLRQIIITTMFPFSSIKTYCLTYLFSPPV